MPVFRLPRSRVLRKGDYWKWRISYFFKNPSAMWMYFGNERTTWHRRQHLVVTDMDGGFDWLPLDMADGGKRLINWWTWLIVLRRGPDWPVTMINQRAPPYPPPSPCCCSLIHRRNCGYVCNYRQLVCVWGRAWQRQSLKVSEAP
jgi:hypothetical protein